MQGSSPGLSAIAVCRGCWGQKQAAGAQKLLRFVVFRSLTLFETGVSSFPGQATSLLLCPLEIGTAHGAQTRYVARRYSPNHAL